MFGRDFDKNNISPAAIKKYVEQIKKTYWEEGVELSRTR